MEITTIYNIDIGCSNKINMYRIKLKDYKIQVVCSRCYENLYGQINSNCKACGGKGVHNKTLQRWEVCKRLELVEKINRDKNGELRYWTAMDSYCQESSGLLHFTLKDATDECNRRNEEL